MPVKNHKQTTTKGFYQFGKSGHKYYYKNLKEKSKAKSKALKQAIAIFASGWREK